MLITRFSKAFYLCNSFLLVATPFTASRHSVHAATPKKDSGKWFVAPVVSTSKITASGPELLSEMPHIQLNKKEALFVRTYIKNRGDCLVNVKKRSIIPFYIIDSVFNANGVPIELKYLSVIESELKSSALSHVGARGPWQLMPETARILGLKVNRQTDDRTDYYKSTRAAARYLKDLYAQFDDWLLVLAAYNGGPKPVYKAIRKSGSRNFWNLQKYLPAESWEHVKKFIATHYYFEGHGSEATLTRSENLAYIRAVNAFETKKTTAAIPFREKEKTETPVRNESSAEKFRRVMEESEESLKKSSRLIHT